MAKDFEVRVRVSVHENAEAIKTRHDIVGVGLEELPAGGLVQTAQALIIEAIRAESYVMLLSKLSLGDKIEGIKPEDLDALTRSQFLKLLDNLGPLIAEETLKRVG